jgi:hypothetical protein
VERLLAVRSRRAGSVYLPAFSAVDGALLDSKFFFPQRIT